MSVIVALISTRGGVVASDGRNFGNAKIDNNDRVIQPASVVSDTFDKTFSLNGGKVIGGFAGLTHFSGKTIAEHVSEIGSASSAHWTTLNALANTIREEMTIRLSGVDPQEVIFRFRCFDLILVAGKGLKRSDMQIVTICFFPKGGVITSEMEMLSQNKQLIGRSIRGDCNAIKAADRYIKQNSAPNRDIAFLKKLATEAVRGGIAATGPHPYGSDLACGGQTFVKHTQYR